MIREIVKPSSDLRAYRTPLALAALSAVSLAIYGIAFARPYSLIAWISTPLMSIEKITHYSPLALGGYLLSMAELFFVYVLASRLVKGRQSGLAWAAIIIGAAAFNAVMLGLYPVDAIDIFDYIIRGRMTALYHANPFYQIPAQFRQDPLIKYSGWPFLTSAYGPLWEAIAAGAAKLAGNSIMANVLVFKGIAILSYAGIAALIGVWLQRDAPERALYGVTLFAWNPLVIYTTAGGGHNDTLMVLLMALGFYALARGRLTLAVLAQMAGALIKFIPVLVLPIILMAALKRVGSWRARASYLLITGGACAVLIAATVAPFWRGGDMLGVSRRETMFTTSLPTLLQLTLQPKLGNPQSGKVATYTALAVIGLWILWQMRAVWRGESRETPVRAALSVLLFYLLVSCPWFQPWYLIWPLSLAAILPDGMLTRGTVLFSFVSLWKIPIFFVVLGVTNRHLPPLAWREWRLTLDTLIVPWTYFLMQGVREAFSVPVRNKAVEPEPKLEPEPEWRRIGT